MTAFNDPEIVRLLSTKVVPVATHVRPAKRQDRDGEFFRKVCKPIPYRQSGACVFTPDGQVLGQCSATSRREVMVMLKATLANFKPPADPSVIEPPGKVDEQHLYVARPPDGAVVVSTIMAHLSEQASGRAPSLEKLRSKTVAMDRLWIRKDEARALSEGTFPGSLKSRIAQWHFVDSITFDQNRRGSIKKFDLDLKDGQFTGTMRIATETGRSMQLEMLGFIESKAGQLTRFDLAARGSRRAREGIPYPVAFVFTLADESHVAFNVPPYPVLGYSADLYLGKR